MAYKVRSSRKDAETIIVRHRQALSAANAPQHCLADLAVDVETIELSELAKLAADVLIVEKGYPWNTEVLFDVAWDEVDMTLAVDSDGSWELV